MSSVSSESIVTDEAPLRLATRAASIATLPVPFAGFLARQDGEFARIAGQKTGVVPGGRQVGEQRAHLGGQRGVGLRPVGHVLDAGLEEDGQRQLVGIGGDVRELAVREGAGGIVHRSDDAAREGERGVVDRGPRGQEGTIVVPFRAEHALHRHHVRPGVLPAARDRAAVEVHQQMVPGGVLEDVQVVVDHAGVVREEEVHLDAADADAFEPGELLFAALRIIQAVLRLGSAFAHPGGAGVVPEVDFDALFPGVGHHVPDAVSAFHLGPFPVHQAVGPALGGGQVDVGLDQAEILGAVVVGPVDPGRDAGHHPVRLKRRVAGEVGHQRGFDDVGQGADDRQTPGRTPVREVRGTGQVHPVPFAVVPVVKRRGAVAVAQVRLAEQREYAVRRLVEGRKAPAAGVAVEARHRIVRPGLAAGGEGIVGLVVRLELGDPAALAFGNLPGRTVLQRFHVARQQVAEGESVVIESDEHVESVPGGILIGEPVLPGGVPAMRPLAGLHHVIVVDQPFRRAAGEGQGGIQVRLGRHESEVDGGSQDILAIDGDGLAVDRGFQSAVRRAEVPAAADGQQRKEGQQERYLFHGNKDNNFCPLCYLSRKICQSG